MRLYQDEPVCAYSNVEPYTAGDSVTPMVIGYRSSTNAEYFDGDVDEVRVYDYALTTAEIKAIYTADGVPHGRRALTPGIGGDVNKDCRVDLLDAAQLGSGWAEHLRYVDPGGCGVHMAGLR